MTEGRAEAGAGRGAAPRPGPLAGVRVLEFSQVVAAPFLGCILADLGADVVKVEPPGGDQHRRWGAVVPDEGKRFQSLNRNKRGIAIDLGRPAGAALARRLVPGFDVVAQNLRPGAAERYGLGYAALRVLRPDLVYCEISGWGRGGPLGGRTATDPTMTAYSGLIAGGGKTGAAGEPLHLAATALADYAAGFSAAAGVLAALYHRALTGEGQRVEASLLRSSLAIQDTAVMREPVSDAVLRDPMMEEVRAIRARGGGYGEILAARAGRRESDTAALRGFSHAYRTADGIVMLGAITPRTRALVREALGIAGDRADDPGYDASDPASIAYGEERAAYMRARFAERTTAEWMDALGAAGVPIAPVQLPEELADDPQVVAAGHMAGIEHAITGPQRVVAPVVDLSATPAAIRSASPAIGAHTGAVLAEAGLGEAEIAALRGDGVVA